MTESSIRQSLRDINRNGRKMPLFIASPQGSGPFPAVIIVHEIFGLNDHIKDIACRFATEGMVAFAPDLFTGARNLPADRNDLNGMRAVWQGIPDQQFIDDLNAVYQHATGFTNVLANKVGTIGYCMGGAIAFMFAASVRQIAWVADYYGRIFYPELTEMKKKHPIEYAKYLSCPMLGLFSGVDDLIPPDHIQALRNELTKSGKNFDIRVYQRAKHAFFNDTREFYDKDAALDAWYRTLDFIGNSITAPSPTSSSIDGI